MKQKSKVFAAVIALVVLIAAVVVAPVGADTPSQEEVAEPTIAEIAVADENFSTLVAALEAADLVSVVADPDASLTVFAPTNDAFAAALSGLGLSAEELLGNTELLTAVLTYHVVVGGATSADAAALDVPLLYTVQGQPVQINVDVEGNVVLNGNVNVVVKDVQAANGVVHVIDAVLLPPAYETEATANIAEVATEAGAFTTLLAAAEAAGLVDTLVGPGPFTVFAPTDDAFAAFLAETGNTAADLLADEDALRDVLMYHIALGALKSGDVVAVDSLVMLNGDSLAVADIPLNTELLDIEASNGVIHVLDGVLVPPTPTIAEVAASNPDFSILFAALEAADLVATFNSADTNATVFAPTNDAFVALLGELGITAEELLANTELLTAVLTYHVADGTLTAADVIALEIPLVYTLEGSPIQANVVDGGVLLNGSINVVAADVAASNGVIHVIDGVLVPDAYTSAVTANIAEVATEAGSFTTLLAAAEAAGLVDTLVGEGPFTVFAPTDAAFAAFLDAAGVTAEELLADTDVLRYVLGYHIVVGAYDSSEVVATTSYVMLNGQELAVADIPLNTELLDIEASNGIIHVLDGVLLPPPPPVEDAPVGEVMPTIAEIAAGNEDFSILVQALTAAGLVDVVADPAAELTVFAPTNAAFVTALAALDLTAAELLGDTETLTQILLYHVVPGKVLAADIVGLTSVPTLQGGSTIGIEVIDGGVVLNGSINIITTDIEASNGVIHVIDGVLLPL